MIGGRWVFHAEGPLLPPLPEPEVQP
jgi:hypothetical protein